MTNYTPGPWEILGEDEECEGVPCIEISAGEPGKSFHSIAYVRCDMDADCEFEITETTHANARLVAAAPDLLAALKTALHVIAELRAYDGIYDNAKAQINTAIDKAEGR